MAQNLLGIVIPVYNRAKIVGRTLASIASQTARGFDCVLVDNGSTDGSPDVLRRWAAENATEARPVKVISEPARGAAAARNAGLRELRTPWVLFFDSDDTMRPGHIQRVLDGIATNPEADILGWDTMHSIRGIRPFKTEHAQWFNLIEGSFATQRWAARTEFVRKAGGWNAEVGLWDDIELSARMLALNPSIVRLEGEPTVDIYLQPDSISTNSNGDYLERMEPALRSIEKYLPPDGRLWCDCKRAIAIGDTMRGASPEVKARCREKLAEILGHTEKRSHRLLLRALCCFKALGGRGQNHILKRILL